MLISYLKISLRYLVKNSTFSAINIFGLTLGFLSFVLIALYVNDELSFDMFHSDASQIYRVLQHETQDDGTIRDVAPVAARIAPEAIKQLPEVEEAVRISALGRITMGNDPQNRDYERLLITDTNFFTFFDFPFASGDPVNALQTPDTIVISETMAKKYFGNEPALGKRIWTSLYRNRQPVEFIVTGVMKDFPTNSHLQLNIVFSDKTWPSMFNWYTEFMNIISLISFTTFAQTQPDRDQVYAAVEDYVDGLYLAQPERIKKSVHPELMKKGFWKGKDKTTYDYDGQMTFDQLVELAGKVECKGLVT